MIKKECTLEHISRWMLSTLEASSMWCFLYCSDLLENMSERRVRIEHRGWIANILNPLESWLESTVKKQYRTRNNDSNLSMLRQCMQRRISEEKLFKKLARVKSRGK